MSAPKVTRADPAEAVAALRAIEAETERRRAAHAHVRALAGADAGTVGEWRAALIARPDPILTARTFDELLREIRAATGRGGMAPAGSVPVIGSPGYVYVPGQSVYRQGRNDEWEQVLDWAPQVHEVLTSVGPDGGPAGRRYRVSTEPDTEPATVRAADLRTGEAWDSLGSGIGSRTVRDVLHNIITGEVRRLTLAPTRVLESTGWHVDQDGRRFYAWPDGRTTPVKVPVKMLGAPARLVTASAAAVPEIDPAEAWATVRGEMYGRGRPQVFHLWKGVRTLGQSLGEVRRGVVVIGDPGSGKTGCLWVERSLTMHAGWEPLTTKGLESTLNSVMSAANFERDMPSIFNDLAVNNGSPQSTLAEARAKLEMLFRSFANSEELRGGLTKDLEHRAARFINSIPSMSAQPKVIELFQESLLRRVFAGWIDAGEVDTEWWRENGQRLLTGPLRVLGHEVVTRLGEGTADEAGELLEECDRVGLDLLRPHADRDVPNWYSTVLADVVRAVGQMIGGGVLLAKVRGVDVSEVVDDATLRWVSGSLARQWAAIGDAHEAVDDLGTAVGDALRAAFLDNRAHIRDQSDEIGPAVPGATEQSQGVRAKSYRDSQTSPVMVMWEGHGAAVRYLPELDGLGVQTGDLHKVFAARNDPRLGRHTARQLPRVLLAAGVSVPSASGYPSTHVVTLGSGKGAPQVRMVVIPRALVFDAPVDPEAPAAPEIETAPAPTPEPVAQPELPTVTEPAAPGTSSADTSVRHPEDVTAPGLAVAEAPEPCQRCGVPTLVRIGGLARHGGDCAPAPIGDEDQGATAASSAASSAPASTTPRYMPWAVATLDGVRGPQDSSSALAAPLRPRDVGELAELGAELVGARGALFVTREVREAAGLPAALPANLGALEGFPHQFVEAAGGEWDMRPGGLAPWMTVFRRDVRGQGCAVVFPEWDSQVPALGAASAEDLAAGLDLFSRTLGVDYRRSPGRTMQGLLKLLDQRARVKRYREAVTMPAPIADGKVTLPGFHAPAIDAAGLAGQTVAALDVNRQFLSATRGTEFGVGTPEHRTGGSFDRKRPGVYRVRIARADCQLASELAPLVTVAGNRKSLDVVLPTELLALLAEHERPFEVVESWTWPQSRRVFDEAGSLLTDARATLAADASPGAELAGTVVKAMYASFFGGWLGSDFGGKRAEDDPFKRRDWWLTVRAQSAARLQRHALRGLAAGARVVGMQTDTLYVVTDDLAALGKAFPINDQNGKFKIEKRGPVTPELITALSDKRMTSAARITALQSAVKGS